MKILLNLKINVMQQLSKAHRKSKATLEKKRAILDCFQRRVATLSPSDPQHHVLQACMKNKGFTHAETAIVDIQKIRIERTSLSATAFFCHMGGIIVQETLNPGDGGDIPKKARFEGIPLPAISGYYDLKNVKLSSNGKIQIMKTPETKWRMLT